MYNIRLTSISLTMVSNSYNTHVVHSIALNPDVSGHLLVPFAERYAYLVSELSDMAIQRVTITRNLEVKNSFHPYHVTQDTTKPGIVPILTVNPLQFKIEPARISIKLDGHKINSRKRKSLVKVTKTTGSLVVPEDTHEHLLVPLAVYYAELFERGGVDNIQRHKIHITRTLERDVDVKNAIHSNPYNKAIFELATNQVGGRKAQLSIPGVEYGVKWFPALLTVKLTYLLGILLILLLRHTFKQSTKV